MARNKREKTSRINEISDTWEEKEKTREDEFESERWSRLNDLDHDKDDSFDFKKLD
jgi:hypothetical protein